MALIPNCGRPEMRIGQEQGEPITIRGQTERQDNQDLFVSAEPLVQWIRVTAVATHNNGKLSKLAELDFLHFAQSASSQRDMKGCGRHERHDQHSFGDD